VYKSVRKQAAKLATFQINLKQALKKEPQSF